MPTIQNQINLYVNATGQLVSGSEPTNVLYRNTLNKNIFFIITPLSQAAVVKLFFQNTSLSKQGYTGVATPTTQRGKDITAKEASYYELVKDWAVFKYIPSSRILTKFPSTVTGTIGLSISIKEPDLSDTTKYNKLGDIIEKIPLARQNSMAIGDFYQAISPILGQKIPPYYEDPLEPSIREVDLSPGDKIVKVGVGVAPNSVIIIRALWTQTITEPLLFVGNPSLEDTDYDGVDIGNVSLLDGIISALSEQSGSILQLQDYLTALTSKYNNMQLTIDGINHEIAVLQGEVSNRYPYYVDETNTTKDLNNSYNTQTGFIYYLSSSKAFLNGPISGQVASPILIQNIGNRQIYFDVTSNKTYTRLRPSNTWTYASEIMVQKYNADLSLKEVVPLENTSKVLIDKDAFELLRTLLTDKVSVETIGSNNLPYSLSLTEFLRLIATPSETLQTKSSVAKYIESLGLLDNIRLVSLSSLYGLAQGVPYLDNEVWKLDFEGTTAVLEDLNMWKDTNGNMFIWFANEAEQINFAPVELPYKFSIEDVIDKKCELNSDVKTFRSSFNLDCIRMTLIDIANSKDITDIINNPEYNFTMTLDTTQGNGGFIPFQYSNDNLVFTSFDGTYLQFNATERTSQFYKGRTTIALKMTFNIDGELVTLLQKVTVNVTGVPVIELDESFELDSTIEDFYNTGLYITNIQKLEVVRKGDKVFQILMENPYRYRIFDITLIPIPEWKQLATLEDLEDFITANDLPDLLTDYATNESVNAKDATTLGQAKAYADQKIAEAVAADIVAKTNFGFKTNADYSQVTLVSGQTTFDFETNTIYTYDGTAWGNPIEVTPQENSEVKLGEWVGPDTDVDINGNSMRGVGVNAVYDTIRGWLYFVIITIVNNITKESDIAKITILSGTGRELNPYVIDKDFRDGHRYYFESTVVQTDNGTVTVYFSYNGEIFSTSAQVSLISTSPYPGLSWNSYKDTVFNGIFSPYQSGLEAIKTSPTIVYDAVRNYILVDMVGGLILSPSQLVIGGSSRNTHAQIPNGVGGTALKSTGLNSNPAFDFLQNMRYDESRYLYQVINQGGVKHITPITWQDLKALRDNNELIAGMKYRITDYTTTTTQAESRSAGNDFDIIVTALDSHTLSENASACKRVGDTYFSGVRTIPAEVSEVTILSGSGTDADPYTVDSEFWLTDIVYRFKLTGGVVANANSQNYFRLSGGSVSMPFSANKTFSSAFTNGVSEPFKSSGATSFAFDTSLAFTTTTGAAAKLESWKLKYSLDNDTERFAWADTENGKGVIYRMIDEFNNDLPYDFKNIQFKRYMVTSTDNETLDENFLGKFFGAKDFNDNWVTNKLESDEEDFEWFYTLSAQSEYYDEDLDENILGDLLDDSVIAPFAFMNDEGDSSACEGNIIKPHTRSFVSGEEDLSLEGKQWLNNIVFQSFVSDKTKEEYPYRYPTQNNKIGYNAYCLTFGAQTRHNTIGNSFYSNTIGNGCNSNTFGNSFYSNTFGKYCSGNTFGNNTSSNTFGNNTSSNTFGNNASSNTFGNDNYNNTFGNNTSSNTFGNDNYNNTFGNNTSSNTFGSSCYYNTFGNGCSYNTFGNALRYNVFENNIRFVRLEPPSNIRIENSTFKSGLIGTSSSNKLDLYDANFHDKQMTFELVNNTNPMATYTLDTSGEKKVFYKSSKTASTWTQV